MFEVVTDTLVATAVVRTLIQCTGIVTSFFLAYCSRCLINGCIRGPFPTAFELGDLQSTDSVVTKHII